ncbi:MAG: ATP-binding protein [Thermoplasmata archaeon]
MSGDLGIILSGATTQEATAQVLKAAEKGKIREGMLVSIESQIDSSKILARISQIIPYNEFYIEGDPFSESRREDKHIPEEVAREYEIAKLELLLKINEGEIRFPPKPGDRLKEIDITKDTKAIFGVERGTTGIIWFGTMLGYENAEVPINIKNLPMHMAVFGVTGSGKSYTMGGLIEKLSHIPGSKPNSFISYPMIIIDANGDYCEYAEKMRLNQAEWVHQYIFPDIYRELDRKKDESTKYKKPIGIDLNKLTDREVAEIILLFSKGGLGEQSELQIFGLEMLFAEMKDNKMEDLNEIFVYHYDKLLDKLDQAPKDILVWSTKAAIKRALNQFREVIVNKHQLLQTDSPLKSDKFVEDITKDGGIAIFDFSAEGAPGVDLKTKQFVMTYLASLLFEKFTEYKKRKETRYLLFIIEEAQNFCPDKTYPVSSSLAHSKLSAIATQGRKFGLSLCLISQRPSFVDRTVLSMMNSFIIHRIAPEDVVFVKSVCGGLPESVEKKLTTLSQGHIIFTGQMNTVPFPLIEKIRKNIDRITPHTGGSVDPIGDLERARGI